MRFVYPLGNGSLHQDFELGCSMRSVAKYCAKPPTFIIIGDLPRTDPGVKFDFIPFADRCGTPSLNTLAKARLACEVTSGEPFIWMNDDIFFLKPFLPGEIGMFHEGGLSLQITHRDHNPDSYYHSLVETRRQLLQRGLRAFNYEVHAPMPVDPKTFGPALSYFDTDKPILFRSCYLNSIVGYEPHNIIDEKIDFPLSLAEITRRTATKTFFSVGDGAFVNPGQMKQFLQQKYE